MAIEQKRVAEVIRVSTLAQAGDDRYGIPAQKAENAETADRYNLRIVRSFEIEGVSGADMMTDPRTQELIALMESGAVDGVVVREFSRLLRPEDYGDWRLLKTFQDNSVTLYLPSGPLDLNEKWGASLPINLRAWRTLSAAQYVTERLGASAERCTPGCYAAVRYLWELALRISAGTIQRRRSALKRHTS
jgi:hypothetical protein